METMYIIPSDTTPNSFLLELKNLITNMSIQINKLEQKLQAQASRIDVIFSAVGI